MMYFESTPSCDLSSNPPKEKYQGGLNSRGCVKMLAQLFFMRKAQTFPSPGCVIT